MSMGVLSHFIILFYFFTECKTKLILQNVQPYLVNSSVTQMQNLVKCACEQSIYKFDSVKYPFHTADVNAMSIIFAYIRIDSV